MVTCTVCRKPVWSPPATPVDTHVRCRIDEDTAVALALLTYLSPRVTYLRMARDLRTSTRIVAIWVRWGLDVLRARKAAA